MPTLVSHRPWRAARRGPAFVRAASTESAVCLLLALLCGTSCSAETAESPADPDLPSDERTSSPTSSPPESPAPGGTPDAPVCDYLYDARDIPFFVTTFPISDACPYQKGAPPLPSSTITHLTREAPGKICMDGQVTTGWASLITSLDHVGAVGVNAVRTATRQPLDAPALGITALRFTLETPPAGGLAVALSYVSRLECTFTDTGCIQSGFYVMQEGSPKVPLRFSEAGTYTLRFVDVQPGPDTDPTQTLDTTRFSGAEFQLGSGLGSFDFCVRDLQLLNDEGEPVTPSGN